MKHLRHFILVGALIVLCAVVAAFALKNAYRIPSDTELASTFEKHRDSFSTLQLMLMSEPEEFKGIVSDKVIYKDSWNRVSPSEANVDPARFSEYKNIMKAGDISQFWRDEDGFTFFSGFSGWGFAGKGPRFSYIYRTIPPQPQLQSLDSFQKNKKDGKIAYRPLAQNWYMRLVW